MIEIQPNLQDYNIYYQRFYQPYIKVDDYDDVIRIVDDMFFTETPRIKRNIVMYVVNILIAENNVVAVSRDNRWFKQKINSDWHTYKVAVSAQGALARKGLVNLYRGYRNIGFVKGFASRLEATAKLMGLFGNLTLPSPEIDVSNCFDCIHKWQDESSYPPEYEPILRLDIDYIKIISVEKNNAECKISVNKEPPNIIKLDTSNSITNKWANTYELNNNYFNQIKLGFTDEYDGASKKTMIRNVYLTRIFTRGGCGRFFQQHAMSYQIIPRQDRKYLTLNGQPTTEIDYSGMHINLLYAKENMGAYPRDPYMDVAKKLTETPDKELREAVKQCILIAINAKDMKNYKKAMFWSNKNEWQLLQNKKISLEQVMQKFAEIHPQIAKYMNSDSGIWLMYKDSNIMEKVLLKLKEINILALPLHDSIICQQRDRRTVKRIMKEIYQEDTGFNIQVH